MMLAERNLTYNVGPGGGKRGGSHMLKQKKKKNPNHFLRKGSSLSFQGGAQARNNRGRPQPCYAGKERGSTSLPLPEKKEKPACVHYCQWFMRKKKKQGRRIPIVKGKEGGTRGIEVH